VRESIARRRKDLLEGPDDDALENPGLLEGVAVGEGLGGVAITRIVYLHVRSAANNCYQCRIERG